MSEMSFVIPTKKAICNLFERGMENSDIAATLDLPDKYVNRVIGSYKTGIRNKQKAAARAKVMAEMRSEGMTNAEICRELCVCNQTVVHNIGKQPKELVHISAKMGAQKRRLNNASKAMRRAVMLTQAAIQAEVKPLIAD
jgi:DNA-binding NarL/FixJ family response regulator